MTSIRMKRSRKNSSRGLPLFAKRLLEAMEIRNCTQVGLSRVTGLSPEAVYQYCAGRTSRPTLKTLGLLATALKVNYKWLRGDEVDMDEVATAPSKEDVRTLPPRQDAEEKDLKEGLMEGVPQTFSAYLDRMLPLLCHFMEDRQKERAAFIECFKEYAKLDETDKAEIRGEMRQMLKAEKYR